MGSVEKVKKVDKINFRLCQIQNEKPPKPAGIKEGHIIKL
jgi:hypothetical protein